MHISRKSLFLALALAVVLLYGTGQAFAAGGATVEVVDTEYLPSTVTIQQGDTVTWNNTDGFHSVDADPGQAETFGNVAAGDPWTYSHTFTVPGTYEYYCEVHSAPDDTDMNGIVIVEAAPTAVTLGTLTSAANMGWTFAIIGAGILLVGGMGIALSVRTRQ